MFDIKSTRAVITMSTSRNALSPLFALIAIAAIFSGADAKPPKRIWGGRLALGQEFAAAVGLSTPGSNLHYCGGAIIGRRHVLTAAHCVDKKSSDRISIRAGIHDIKDVQNAVEKLVSRVIIHPNYISYIQGQRAVENDLAILVLKDDLPIGGRISSFRLPQHEPEKNVYYFAAGWGKNSPNPTTYQYDLKTIDMQLLDASRCNSRQNEVICGVNERGAICAGDSGSPLIRTGYLYGIASTSNCEPGDSATFVNVWHYIDWINDKIRQYPY